MGWVRRILPDKIWMKQASVVFMEKMKSISDWIMSPGGQGVRYIINPIHSIGEYLRRNIRLPFPNSPFLSFPKKFLGGKKQNH